MKTEMELELNEGYERMDVTSKNDFNTRLSKILRSLPSVHHILNSSVFSWKESVQTPGQFLLAGVMCE